MKKSLKIVTAFIASCISFNLFATPLSLSNGDVHIWHNIYAKEGEWNAELQIINQADKAWFVLPDGVTKVKSLKITPDSPKKTGLFIDFAQHPDFDLAYTVTLVKNEKSTHPQMTSKSCIFLVTASAPGKPDINILSYNGATCSWKAGERGEDFYVA